MNELNSKKRRLVVVALFGEHDISTVPARRTERLIDKIALTATGPIFDSRDAAIANATNEHTEFRPGGGYGG
jgi:hypothetical protein